MFHKTEAKFDDLPLEEQFIQLKQELDALQLEEQFLQLKQELDALQLGEKFLQLKQKLHALQLASQLKQNDQKVVVPEQKKQPDKPITRTLDKHPHSCHASMLLAGI